MESFEHETNLVAYCGIYCRLCDYFMDKVREPAKNLLETVKKHGEIKIFAEHARNFNYEDFVKGLDWMSTEFAPCIGACKGGGGWGECPIRKCCIKNQVNFCYECKQFPCDAIKQFPKRLEALNEMKKAWIRKLDKETASISIGNKDRQRKE